MALFKTVEVANATGLLLDLLVAKADCLMSVIVDGCVFLANAEGRPTRNFNPSSNATWACAIMDREEISVLRTDSDDYHVDKWAACKGSQQRNTCGEGGGPYYQQYLSALTFGPTRYAAAMRCHVINRLGARVRVPQDWPDA